MGQTSKARPHQSWPAKSMWTSFMPSPRVTTSNGGIARSASPASAVPTYREKDAKLAQKLGQLQLFLAVFPQEYTGRLASFGPT